jgi:hypothetical protein
VGERKLIFPPVFFAQVAPITARMAPKEIAGLFAGIFERGEGTGSGDDLTELKWLAILLCHKTDSTQAATRLRPHAPVFPSFRQLLQKTTSQPFLFLSIRGDRSSRKSEFVMDSHPSSSPVAIYKPVKRID